MILSLMACGKKIENNRVETKPDLQKFVPKLNSTEKLYNAIENNDHNLVNHMLESIEKLDFHFDNGETPLTLSLKHAKDQISQILIDHDPTIEFQNEFEQSPMEIIIDRSKSEVLNYIINKGLKFSTYVLEYSILSAEKDLSLTLINYIDYSQVDLDHFRILRKLSAQREMFKTYSFLDRIINHFQDSKVDFNYVKDLIYNAPTKFVNFIFKTDVSVQNVLKENQLANSIMGIKNPNYRVLLLKTYISVGGNINDKVDNLSPLLYATIYDLKEEVKVLTKGNLDPFTKDQFGKNALEHAVNSLQRDIAIDIIDYIKRTKTASAIDFKSYCKFLPRKTYSSNERIAYTDLELLLHCN